MTALVFVYGSLKKGFHNHRLLETSNFRGNTKIEGYRMVSLGAFPGIIPVSQPIPIFGEVYEVDQPTMVSLDRLEGHPHFYHREPVETELGRAWVYVLPEHYSDKESVPSGEWKHAASA